MSFESKRLSKESHYFELSQIGKLSLDDASSKQDNFVEIRNFLKFVKPVPISLDGNYIENIPQNKISNYWRYGVRGIDEPTFNKIKRLAEIDDQGISAYNGVEIASASLESEFYEGGKKVRYTTTYERSAQVREQAVSIHGYSCIACGFNFEKVYGEWG